jgi:hypothetical protein
MAQPGIEGVRGETGGVGRKVAQDSNPIRIEGAVMDLSQAMLPRLNSVALDYDATLKIIEARIDTRIDVDDARMKF